MSTSPCFSPHIRRDYLPELQRAREAREKNLQSMKDESLSRFMKDLSVDRAQNPAAAQADRWDPTEEGEEDDDDDMDVNIIDRSESPPFFLLSFRAGVLVLRNLDGPWWRGRTSGELTRAYPNQARICTPGSTLT